MDTVTEVVTSSMSYRLLPSPSPFKNPGPGRPKLSQAAIKRRQKFRKLAASIHAAGQNVRYCIVTASGDLWKIFEEFSGIGGAKEALDLSDLKNGSAVIRVCDGVELARRSASGG